MFGIGRHKRQFESSGDRGIEDRDRSGSEQAEASAGRGTFEAPGQTDSAAEREIVIELTDADYTYQAGGPFASAALHGVNMRVRRGTLVGIAGGTGSGKSTLLQLLNGLLLPTGGSVRVLDHTLLPGMKKPKLNALRRRIGLSFQFPEQHLFEDTVEKDLMFGPLNFGLPKEEAQRRAAEALASMGLGEELLLRHPLTLSGGQMRRVAIASVLAAGPEIMMLDEPTATLDSAARRELIALLARLCREEGRTILMVTHRIEELLEAADEWIVMHEGRAVFRGDADELADRADELAGWGVAVPEQLRCWAEWTARLPQLAALPLPRTADDMALRIAEAVRGAEISARSGNVRKPFGGAGSGPTHLLGEAGSGRPPAPSDKAESLPRAESVRRAEAETIGERGINVCATS
ncbi:ATP-binding cassette domain-containing protein [Saccharibacillus alkalitolerans]|uniref:ATP-binding cassette domain-containing protein n=1 Tax=Saccharibacillus alkalitolerans TaxID=2705290 RepID=UPI002E2CB75A|nr:ATP-binding cassette domain-containing protein [Saccharibacillus alkalitolerans]